MDTTELQNSYLDALLAPDKHQALKIIDTYIKQGNMVTSAYENIIKPSLYRVGELWETNVISVAQEHVATAVTEDVMNFLIHYIISEKRTDKTILLGCVENEYHQVGIKMVADMFESVGWSTHFLGSNTPTKELIRYAKTINPSVIALSASIYFNMAVLRKMATEITNALPDIIILAGGQAFRHGGKQLFQDTRNLIIIENLFSLQEYITKNLTNE